MTCLPAVMKGSRLSMGSSVAAVSIGLKLCHSRGIQRNLGRVSGRQVWFKRDKEPSISSTSWMTISLTSPKPALWLTMECSSRGHQLMATKQAIKNMSRLASSRTTSSSTTGRTTRATGPLQTQQRGTGTKRRSRLHSRKPKDSSTLLRWKASCLSRLRGSSSLKGQASKTTHSVHFKTKGRSHER